MKFNSNSNPEIVKQNAISALNKFLQKNKEKKVLFLSSGGSCLNLIDGIEAESFSPNLTIALIDDRFTQDPEFNNYKILISKINFIEKVKTFNSRIIDTTSFDGENPDDFAKRYQTLILNWIEQNPDGIVFATFGIGKDGHTTGVTPKQTEDEFNNLFINTEKYYIAHEFNDPNFKYRITCTLKFLKEFIQVGIVYETGKDSLQMWQSIICGKAEFYKTPAKIFSELENIEIFTDAVI